MRSQREVQFKPCEPLQSFQPGYFQLFILQSFSACQYHWATTSIMLVAHKYVCGTLIGFMTFGEAAAQGPQFLYPIPGSQVTYNYYDTLNLSWTVPLRYPATLVYSLLCAAANVLESKLLSPVLHLRNSIGLSPKFGTLC